MAKQLKSITEGGLVKLEENGVLVPFYIAKHDYEPDLNGLGRTLVVRKECYDNRQWHSSDVNAYASSTIDTWLNGTYKNLFPSDVQVAMGITDFYYTPGLSDKTVASLRRSVFLLSVTELNLVVTSNSYGANIEGEALAIANVLQIAYLDSSESTQWTRSINVPPDRNATSVWSVKTNGELDYGNSGMNRFGSRPAFTLPSTIMVSDTPDADGCYTIDWSYLGSKGIGDTVKIKVDGTPREFLVVNQGRPSTMYDESCDGSWVLMKDIYENRQWHSSNTNDWANSTLKSYLDSTFLNRFESSIQNIIKQVKIPYRPGSGTSMSVSTGANGLSCKIFLLSNIEMGGDPAWGHLPSDGARLAYFILGNGTDACNKRTAHLNGPAVHWWSRSPHTDSDSNTWFCFSYGGCSGANGCVNIWGVRPAFILSPDTPVQSDGSIILNEPPTTPGSINVPTTIDGGSTITLSWAVSTDADGNLAGYKLERSINGGAWSQIYQSTATSYTDTITFGWQSVQYRVKAYDSEGAESGWRTSETRSVFNNTAPTVPPSISVPETPIGGKPLVLSWGASTDAENNLSGYELERSVAGGAWAQVYKGSALTYTDTITKGWATVAYRVRAYDAKGATSAYTTSPTRTVDNNTAPTITSPSSGDLGTKVEGFAISYTVDDADNDTLTVVETMDGTTKRTYTPTSGAADSYDVTGTTFQTLLNGPHTMTATVTDPGGKSAALSLTWTKAVHACEITLAQPMETDAAITMAVISVSRSVPDDATFQVLLTNNGKDAQPVWEDATNSVKVGLNYLFTNATAANGFAFNFRVKASRGPSGQGGWIGSIGGAFQ